MLSVSGADSSKNNHGHQGRTNVRRHSRERFILMLSAGIITGFLTGFFWHWGFAFPAGWDLACLIYLLPIWFKVSRFSEKQLVSHASKEDPARLATDSLLVGAALVSLISVLYMALQVGYSTTTIGKITTVVFALVSVSLSWVLVQTLFALRYADLYVKSGGGIDFNQSEAPTYKDFAYVAFGLGMTFQVADTNITSSVMRSVILRHTLISYVFSTVILASTISVVVGVLT